MSNGTLLERVLSRLILLVLILSAQCISAVARAEDKSGVSPTRVRLPTGPGSLGGVGENAQPNLGMGLVSYSVPIALPSGYEGMTPELRLSYSSGSGNGEAGIGWSLGIPSIERMTVRGLPRYVDDDVFVANGGEELVRLPGTFTYRARHEGSFVRYSWEKQPGSPQTGYWKAEFPDGRVGYFGARADGSEQPSAVLLGAAGAFRYQLVELVDVLGHKIRYDYQDDGGIPLLSTVSYVFRGEVARYQVKLSYETRPDQLSDAKPGLEIRRSKRLRGIQVLSGGTQLRRYLLSYEAPAASTALSRLASVEQFGVGDEGPYGVAFAFGYSGSLDAACTGDDCAVPKVTSLSGGLPLDLKIGSAEVIDINGDNLPDVIDTAPAKHNVYLQSVQKDGTRRFDAPSASRLGGANLSSPHVQLLDLDGDGLTDLVNTETESVLWNRGGGDWDQDEHVGAISLPDLALDANVRFFDYDNDKRIDALHSDETSSWVYVNEGDAAFSRVDFDIDTLGASFTTGLQLADMNGDGLIDAVRAASGVLAYKLNLGWGHFSDWIEMSNVPESLEGVRYADLNGDALADLVVVRADAIIYSLNRNGKTFSNIASLAGSSDLPIPISDSTWSIRFADMNGNGSTDIVWFEPGGQVTFLDVFPERPNLLTRIENGIGKIIQFQFGSTTEHMFRDGGPSKWKYRLPHAMPTLDRIDTFDTLSGLHQIQAFHYRNGYYDGLEKQFRGFADVEVTTDRDESVEDGTTTYHFDVGATDSYRKGLLLAKTVQSGARVLSEAENDFADCPLAELPPSTGPPIRFVCLQNVEVTVKEGAAKAEWLTTKESYEYDGYGNRTKVAKLGITAIGGGGCGICPSNSTGHGMPCGSECAGDERYEETTYVAPSNTGGRWILSRPAVTRTYSTPNAAVFTEETTHYDGKSFEGLPAGSLTRGLVTRVEARVLSTDAGTVDKQRARFNEHGQPVEILDANGHRSTFEFDTDGLLTTAETRAFDDPGHAPYSLRMAVSYDPVLDLVVEATPWVRTEPGSQSPTPLSTRYRYDAFGRMTALASPGDDLDAPTEAYEYTLTNPVSKIVRRTRSKVGGHTDLEQVQCFDGMGRKYQTLTRVDELAYQADGYISYNSLNEAGKKYHPYRLSSGGCERLPPATVPFEATQFDATERATGTLRPDAELYGTASTTRTEYGPLRITTFDEEDTNAGGRHENTPSITWEDGLGRTVKQTRFLRPGQALDTRFFYDETGQLAGYVDAKGNRKEQERDLLGRVQTVRDPDLGEVRFTFDAAGNKLTQTDARGQTTEFVYDEANRLLARWSKDDPDATTVRYAYDSAPDCSGCSNSEGRLVRVAFPMSSGAMSTAGSDEFGYDARGQQTFFARTLEGHRFEFVTEYDNAGRISSRKYPTGQTVESTLDGLGRVVGVPGFVHDVAYDDQGTLSGLAFENGVRTQYGHDVLDRLNSIESVSPSQQKIQSYRYTRDRVGNLLVTSDASNHKNVPSSAATYEYDAWYRLSGALFGPPEQPHEKISYEYDVLDNLTSKVSSLGAASLEHIGAYTYGDDAGPHAATTVGDVSLHYDPSGNLVRRGDDVFEWDYFGRLVSAHRKDLDLGSYSYGPDRDRVKKVEGTSTTYYVTPEFEVRDGAAVLYIRVANQRVAKVETRDFATSVLPDLAPAHLDGTRARPEPDGKITAADAWVAQASVKGVLELDSPQSDAVVAQLLSAAARRFEQADRDNPVKVTFLHVDQLGSVTATTDASGNVVEETATFPYGREMLAKTPVEIDYGFSGQELDRETNLHYFGARYYAAREGRWVSPDPSFLVLISPPSLGTREALTSYAFVDNNPLRLRDASGESLEDFAKGALSSFTPEALATGAAIAIVSVAFPPVGIAFAVAGAFGLGVMTGEVLTGTRITGEKMTEAERDYQGGAAVVGWVSLGLAARAQARAAAAQTEATAGATCPCFAAGTQVVTLDGSKAIETVRVGDLVLSRDEATGEVSPQRVTQVFVTPEKEVLALSFQSPDGAVENLLATPGHPFWVDGLGWVPARELALGMTVQTAEHRLATLSAALSRDARRTVYNFEVEGTHSYFVGETGAWVHNVCNCGGGQARLPQDVAAKPTPPDPLPLNRPVGTSPAQNAQVQADIAAARAKGGTDFRVNQQQVNAQGDRVGVNRPDLQYTDANGQRQYIEYDTPSSGRALGHQTRLLANDPTSNVTLKTIP